MERRSLWMNIIALSVVYCCTIGVKADMCIVERDNPCRCTTHSISIDLSTYFTDPQVTVRDGDDLYVYSPCHSTVINATANNISALVWQIKNQYSKTRARRYNALGRDNDMEWSINSTDPLKFQITYNGGDTHENKNRSAVVYFIYSSNVTEIIYSGGKGQQYLFQVCGDTVKMTSNHHGNDASISIGIVGLVIIILCVVTMVTYCTVGVVYNYNINGRRGCDVIPHVDYWKELPFLLKDGCQYTISPCTQRNHGAYQKL